MAKAPAIEFEQFIWQPRIDGLPHDVPVQLMISDGALEPETPQTQLYLGMGEGRLATRAGLNVLSTMGIPSTGVILPFHHLPCNAANIERTLTEAPVAVAFALNERADTTSPVSLLGHSQGGGTVLIAAATEPKLFNNIGALSPAGLTAEAFGTTLPERRREFLERILLKNTVLTDQNPLRHPGNLLAGGEVFSFMIKDILKGRLGPKLNYGFKRSGLDYVDMLVTAFNRNVAIFGGETDPVFPVSEYLLALGSVGLEGIFQAVPGSHANPLAATGRQQLRAVGQWLLDSREAQQQSYALERSAG